MEAVFTLAYPEYIVAEEIARHLHKADGYSVCIPLSRQQQGMDLLVHSLKTKKSATIQIKSSRAYPRLPSKKEPRAESFDYHLWFKALNPKVLAADFYAFVGLFPKRTIIHHRFSRARQPRNWWSQIIILLTSSEMRRFLREMRGQRFFYIGFNMDLKRVEVTRGTPQPEIWTPFLLDKSIRKLSRFLKF